LSPATALEAIARVLGEGGDVDDVLRDVVAALVEHGGCRWAGILFAEAGEQVLGPEAGSQSPELRLRLPVVFGEAAIAELLVDGCPDEALAGRVAELLSPYCLVGWDTGGVPWEEVE
jgi:hypothetical protein